MKIVSWNINGIRSLVNMPDEVMVDIICLQETKISQSQVTDKLAFLDQSYQSFWSFSKEKKGYSGVAIYLKKDIPVLDAWEGLNHKEIDLEGRSLFISIPGLTIINVYVPNGNQGEDRVTFKLEFNRLLLSEMKKFKNVILLGDLNTTVKEIDTHKNKLFFSDLERGFFSDCAEAGLIDVWRKLNPDKPGYTWYDPKTYAKSVNKGWRLDYFICDENTFADVVDCQVLRHVEGSDHIPILLQLQDKIMDQVPVSTQSIKYKAVCSKFFPHLVKKQTTLAGFFKRKTETASVIEKKQKTE